MYIHICTHTCTAPLCLFVDEISIYLSNIQPIQKEAEPQITGDERVAQARNQRETITTCCPHEKSHGDFHYHCKPLL